MGVNREGDGGPLPLGPEEFVDIITRTTGDAIVTIDASSTILFINAAIQRIFGYRPDELLGESLNLLMPEYLRRLHDRALQRYLDTGRRHVDWEGVELPGLHRDGHEIMLEVAFGESISKGRRIFTGIIRDVSERKAQEAALREKDEALERLNERLLHDALHDSLTGLPNRVLLLDRLEQVLRRRKDDPGRDAALLFLDFDRFKVVNDSLGHSVGDAMLTAISHVLQRVVRPEDTVARLGGDEFVILLDHVDDERHSVHLAERIEAAFDEPLTAASHLIHTSASIGIVPSMMDYEDRDAVLRDADTAMYRAKAMGRGCYQVFDQGMRERAIATLELETDLREALKRNEFSVRYAPIHRIGTRELLGFEALVHWEHPRRGHLPPAEFLPVATDLGIMRHVDGWVWREASRTVNAWRARFRRPLLLSLNFSGQHFLSPEPHGSLLDILGETGAALDQTVIELNESTLHDASDEMAAALQDLSSRGVRVHLDDFGTGHSSLYALHRFSIDALKIDRSIVAGMTGDPRNVELVRTIVDLAAHLNLGVIAEGVEDEFQREHLERMNCACAQGYLFSPPLAADDAARYVQSQDGAPGASCASRPT